MAQIGQRCMSGRRGCVAALLRRQTQCVVGRIFKNPRDWFELPKALSLGNQQLRIRMTLDCIEMP